MDGMIERAMKGYGETGMRLVYGRRWLVFSDIFNVWIVYERKYAAHNATMLIETADLEDALDCLVEE